MLLSPFHGMKIQNSRAKRNFGVNLSIFLICRRLPALIAHACMAGYLEDLDQTQFYILFNTNCHCGLFFFYNFLEAYFTSHTIHSFQAYNPMIFKVNLLYWAPIPIYQFQNISFTPLTLPVTYLSASPRQPLQSCKSFCVLLDLIQSN